jgi:hypothetical protein
VLYYPAFGGRMSNNKRRVSAKSKGRKQQNKDLVLTLMTKFGQATTNKESQQKY